MHAHHDMGGQPAGPIDKSEHELAPWEKRVHALLTLLSNPCRDVMNVHELRRGIESLGQAEYDRLKYYERWITSIANNLIAKGVISVAELGQKLAEIEMRTGNQP
jgi:hypothetical protein